MLGGMTALGRTDPDPRWVDAILDWRWTWLAARIALTGAFILGGLTKLLDFPAAVAEQEGLGLYPGWLWAGTAIVVELIGPTLIISGRLVWLGAGALGVLTAIATVTANDFWALHGHERFVAANTFFEHISIIAGFVMAALIAGHAERTARRAPAAAAPSGDIEGARP
jgi:uncharacterized membrane protein YphA (DoxX/SURF4 family)